MSEPSIEEVLLNEAGKALSAYGKSIEKTLKDAEAAAKEIEKAYDSLSDEDKKAISDAISEAQKAYDNFEKEANKAMKEVSKAVATQSDLLGSVYDCAFKEVEASWTKELAKAEKAIEDSYKKNGVEKAYKTFEKKASKLYGLVSDDLEAEYKAAEKAIDASYADMADALLEAVKEVGASFIAAKEAVEKTEDEKALNAIFKDFKKVVDDAGDDLAKIYAGSEKAAADAYKGFADALTKAEKTVLDAAKKDGTEDAYKDLEKAVATTLADAEKALAEAYSNTEPVTADAFKNIEKANETAFNNVKDQIIKSFFLEDGEKLETGEKRFYAFLKQLI